MPNNLPYLILIWSATLIFITFTYKRNKRDRQKFIREMEQIDALIEAHKTAHTSIVGEPGSDYIIDNLLLDTNKEKGPVDIADLIIQRRSLDDDIEMLFNRAFWIDK